MILAVDIGNTNIVLGGYQNEALVFSTRLATDKTLEADQYALQLEGILRLYHLRPDDVVDAVLSSVVPPMTDTLCRALGTLCGVKPLVLHQSLRTGVTVDIENPAELGDDLLAGAIAARAAWPLPAVVLDLGTATKMTAVDETGAVRGVSIMPGVLLSLNALVSGASQLGGLALCPPAHAIGRTTVESMQSGIVLGTASMLDGMLDRFEAELGCIRTVLATGGIAGMIVPHCKRDVTLAPNLLLDGLYHVWKCNR